MGMQHSALVYVTVQLDALWQNPAKHYVSIASDLLICMVKRGV